MKSAVAGRQQGLCRNMQFPFDHRSGFECAQKLAIVPFAIADKTRRRLAASARHAGLRLSSPVGGSGWAISQELDAEFGDQAEVFVPVLIMTAAFHLVDASPTTVDRRNAVLDAGAEHKGRYSCILRLNS